MSSFARSALVFGWLAALSAALVFMNTGQADPQRKVTDFDEINVHRINIIEPDGKPRVIISNRAEMAGIYWGGKEYKHSNRDNGGMLFFNDDGDEVGGMLFKSRHQGDQYGAASSLLFDQYHQDQILGLQYGEENGRREAGMVVWDRPDQSIQPLIELSDRLVNATTEEERAKIRAQQQEMKKSFGPSPKRLFAGKSADEAVVKLADKAGHVRLQLKVDAAGTASVEFLDESGKVTRKL